VLQNAEIYLIDNLLNITHDLTSSAYQFEVEEVGKNQDRFTLKFNISTVLSTEDVDFEPKEELIISSINDGLKFKSNKIMSSLMVYDILGRKLIDVFPESKLFEIKTASVKPGTILVVEAILANNSVINKKTIVY
jgi:hypothetical protein